MPYSMLPSVVRYLLIANGLMFIVQSYAGPQLVTELALWPLAPSDASQIELLRPHFQFFQIISYSFLHGSPLHLLLNMYGLWLFGSRMENTWGSRRFLIYYFVCVIGAGITQLIVSTLSGDYYATIGASGGVYGILLAFGMRYPNEVLMLIFPPIPIKAKWLVLIFAGIELWAGVSGSQAGIAHFAHLGGMFFGLMLILYWYRHPRNPFR